VQALSPSNILLLLLGPLLLWRVYARFRKMVGKQRLSKYRAPITLVIFPALTALIGFSSRSNPSGLLWLACGLLGGAALGVFGLRKTSFEPTPKGLFYTPNAHLGIALSLLFIARIAYRIVQVYVLEPQAVHTTAEFAQSPLTLSVFGLLAGYYIAYAIGLARWRAAVFRAKRQREALRRDA
jgi:xanthine/uracil/vitamin C permease (AzgA family)